MNISIDTYRVGTLFVRENRHRLSDVQYNLVSGWLRSRQFKELASIASDPRFEYHKASDLRFLLQVEALFKKNSAFTDADLARSAAVDSFIRGERVCRITNKRLEYYYSRPERLDPELNQVIENATFFIERLLGDQRKFMDELPKLVQVTSGATASLPRRRSLPALKFLRTVDCCPGTVPYLRAMARFTGCSIRMESTTTNRVEFVPKNWKTDRGIACEPTGSLPFQLAFDRYAKRRLKLYGGVDLSSQSKNQEHALEGSISGRFATIDLSMASDTLALNCVAWLLPPDWFNYLMDHRASQFRLDGKIGTYAKFSSMGNGCTFALETLVFLALVRACGCNEGVVYGDDITITTAHAPLLYRALKFFGFIPNVDKSFTEGPFRESCGKHYYSGTEVTPFYLRDVGLGLPNLCHNLNGLFPISEHGELWDYLRGIIREYNVPLVPYTYDSSVGVWIHPTHAYRAKIIRYAKYDKSGRLVPSREFGGLHCIKGLSYNSDSLNVTDYRSLLLWHLRVLSKEGKRDPVCTSRYTVSSPRWRRRWIYWVPPVGCWDGLYGLSCFLSADLPARTQ